MNERIRLLAEQATSIVEMVNPQGYTSSYANFDREKFALLIIREYARIAIEKQTKNDVFNIVSENPAKDFAYALVEHFGVEE
jgi:hypothetical protein